MEKIITNIKLLELETIENLKSSKSTNTTRAYKSDFKDFLTFCRENNLDPFSQNLKNISLYLTSLTHKKLKFSTIKRRLVSIVMANRLKGNYVDIKNPVIYDNLLAIKKKIGNFQKGKKAISLEHLKNVILSINHQNLSDLKAQRDKTIILLGFAGGFRRSELVSLDVEDLDFVTEGVKIMLKKSKTDKFSEGYIKAIPYFNQDFFCPVKSLSYWIKISDIKQGPLFRKISKSDNLLHNRLTDQTVALILKKHLTKAGYNSLEYSGHSLRSGFATSTAEMGADERSIMTMTGHKSTQMVRRYIKQSNLFKNNALNKIKF
jgi:site-specific recombinase XerD